MNEFEEYKMKVLMMIQDLYGLDMNDAGLDDERLHEFLREGWEPATLVQWLGQKYDLTSKYEIL
jgi:hypothetical protein